MEVHELPRAFPAAKARMIADSVPEVEFVAAPAESLVALVGGVDALIGTLTPALMRSAGPGSSGSRCTTAVWIGIRRCLPACSNAA